MFYSNIIPCLTAPDSSSGFLINRVSLGSSSGFVIEQDTSPIPNTSMLHHDCFVLRLGHLIVGPVCEDWVHLKARRPIILEEVHSNHPWIQVSSGLVNLDIMLKHVHVANIVPRSFQTEKCDNARQKYATTFLTRTYSFEYQGSGI